MFSFQFDLNKFFNKRIRILRHVFFWLAILIWLFAFNQYPANFSTSEIACFLLQNILTIAIPAYINNYFVLPTFNKNKYVAVSLFIGQLAIVPLVMPYFLDLIRLLFVKFLGISHWINWHTENLPFKTVGYVAMATIFKYAKDKLVRSKEQKEAELAALKNQLNPHFLFNTLNNLYGLSVKKSDNLPQLMLKLSELLRYSIYDTNKNFVPLVKELDYIRNYIDLERLRIDNRTEINLAIEGDCSYQKIAPLLLIVFVENCFKHYSFNKYEEGYIHINFSIAGDMLGVEIKNSKDPQVFPETTDRKGIGLSNAKKRLNMIYPQKHSLIIKNEPDFFEVHLQVNLKL